ncbi:MAG: sulfatase [Acidobacteria bacterium]|nr:sulfatase [Acidobacteriota bacterium]
MASATFRLRPGLALLSIVAIFSLFLEIQLLEQLDSLRRYMTAQEIAVDAGFALLLLLAIAFLWWLGILAAGGIVRLLAWRKRCSLSWLWYCWLLPPAAYLVLRFARALRMAIFPTWRGGVFLQIFCVLGLTWLFLSVLRKGGVGELQRTCRSRFAPIAWAHFGLVVLALIMSWGQGVYLFHNFSHPGRSVRAENLADIYLITIDTLRAEDTSLYGYSLPTTPNLERFAQKSFTFDYFFANSNFTTPTTTTIETGKLPWSHRVFQFGGFTRDQTQQENLAAALRQRGYYTAMISSNFAASPFHHRTLTSYDTVEYAPPLGTSGFWLKNTNLIGANTQATLAYSLLHRLFEVSEALDRWLWRNRYFSPAEAVFSRARKLLERKDISQPRFVWVHIFPPHDPYWPPQAYENRFQSSSNECSDFHIQNPKKTPQDASPAELRACYDEMVLYADHAVGKFLDWLQQTGRLEHSLVIISADHGESFEHARLLHGGPQLYNGLIHVPLLIHVPGQKQGARIPQLSQQADLLPTILDFAGIPTPSWSDGASLKPALEDKPIPGRYVFSMNFENSNSFAAISQGNIAVLDDEFKLVHDLKSRKESLYQYKTDYQEKHNVLQAQPAAAQRLRTALQEKLLTVNESYAPAQGGQ